MASYQGLPVLPETPPSRRAQRQQQSQQGADGSMSVVLNIDNTSDTSASSNELNVDEEAYNQPDTGMGDGNVEDDVDEQEGDEEEVLHCDDWEVRMLAAELNRRESQQHEAAMATASQHALNKCSTSSFGDDLHGSARNLRRRQRKPSAKSSMQSDSEHSDADTHHRHQSTHHHGHDRPHRPRAASLDQHNLQPHQQQHSRRRSNPVHKAMSFDRDKDRL